MTDTTLRPIEFAPGINRDVTEYSAEGGYVDCDWVRFRQGKGEKIGGWVGETVAQETDPTVNTFTGVARDIVAWSDLQSRRYLAVGTHQKLELFFNNEIFDLTPIREENNLTDAITTVNGSSIVTITDTGPHNVQVGDFVLVNSQAAPINGITLSGQYQVVDVPSAATFTIDAGTAATGDGTGGGALDIDYLLGNGDVDNGNLTGWSGGTWNTPGEAGQGWNRPRAGVGGASLRQWSLDTWGEDLIAGVFEGGIYQWDVTSGPTTRAQIIANAPTENLFVLVSQPSRHLIAFGSEVFTTGIFDPLIIRWASQETLTEWDITADNTAGEFRLPKGNAVRGVIQTRGEILIFTDSEIYSMRFVGGNQVFDIQPLGTNATIAAPHAAIDVNGVVYWWGDNSFYVYDGVVRIIDSTIDKYVFDQDGDGRVNRDQSEKIFGGINKTYNEVWWFYPRYDNLENSHYIIYNYLENLWYYGTLDRVVWEDTGVFDDPYAIDASGRLYVHEEGQDADGAPRRAFLLSAYFDVDQGEELFFVDRIVPDIRLPASRNIEISLDTKRYPHPNAQITTKGPYFFDDSMDKISMRARARQMAIRYEVTGTGTDFEIGKVRIGLQTDGERG